MLLLIGKYMNEFETDTFHMNESEIDTFHMN